MNGRFGPGAARFFSVASRVLAWRPGEFWAATPAELIGALKLPSDDTAFSREELNQLMERDNA